MRLSFCMVVSVLVAFGLFSNSAEAATQLKTFDSAGALVQSLSLSEKIFSSGAEIAAGDVDGDGEFEYLLAPTTGAARIFVYSKTGTLKHSFPVLDGKFSGGVNISVNDLDADGVAEIVVAAKAGGGPQVALYTGAGNKRLTFLAYHTSFRGGVAVATGDINGDGVKEIVTASGYESPGHVRAFSATGRAMSVSFFPFGERADAGASLAVGNVDPTNVGEEIVVGPLGSAEPRVLVLNHRGTELTRFSAFPSSVNRGLSLATALLSADPAKKIVVAPRNAAPHIRVFDGDGAPSRSFFSFEKSFRGDTSFSGIPDGTLAVVAQPLKIEGRRDLVRYIEIDLAKQRLSVFRLGRKLGEYRVSTGKWSMPTPTGTFTTRNKIRTAYSRRYRLYMDYWMAITPDGAYGIHALPYWVLKNGTRVYEGTDHLGTPVSHGCIRLHPSAAKTVYDWASIGTTVIIHR